MLTTHFSNLYMTPAVVKKLLGFKVNPPTDPAASEASGASSSAANKLNAASLLNHNKLCEKAIRQLVKKLKKTPGAIEELEKAITTRNPNTKCISIPLKSNMQQSQQLSRKTLPHVVCCRIWRWADLQNCNELKSVQHCQHAYNHHAVTSLSQTTGSGKKAADSDNSPLVCINPYHYIRCDSNQSMQQQQAASTNLLTVYVPLTSTTSHMSSQMSTNELSPIAEDEATNSTSSSTASTPISYSHSPNGSGSQQHAIPTQISSSSSTSSSSSLQNELVMPQLMTTSTNTTTTTTTTSSTTDLIHSSNFMMTASPSEPVMFTSDSSSILPGPGMLGCFLRSHSPDSPLASAHMNMNGCINMNMSSQSPISNSPAFNNAMQQFSPFISEDDSSEINDISPSPIGTCDLMPIPMIEQPYWCSLSYYEMKQRVGEMFHVASNVHSVTIDGYTDPSSAQRFCLGVLSNVNRTNEIEMTRHYIGRGLMLNYENGQVFAECLSDNPVFVQSPNCNQRYHWHLATVVKIPPGCSLKIFDEADFVQLANETVYQGFEAVYALTRICTIRISFVKGWGAEYKRQTILNTPCWIEVHLNNPLKLVDQILTKMGSPRTKCTSFS